MYGDEARANRLADNMYSALSCVTWFAWHMVETFHAKVSLAASVFNDSFVTASEKLRIEVSAFERANPTQMANTLERWSREPFAICRTGVKGKHGGIHRIGRLSPQQMGRHLGSLLSPDKVNGAAHAYEAMLAAVNLANLAWQALREAGSVSGFVDGITIGRNEAEAMAAERHRDEMTERLTQILGIPGGGSSCPETPPPSAVPQPSPRDLH